MSGRRPRLRAPGRTEPHSPDLQRRPPRHHALLLLFDFGKRTHVEEEGKASVLNHILPRFSHLQRHCSADARSEQWTFSEPRKQ
ncbi:unnamed protein product [Urochloa humidicola]